MTNINTYKIPFEDIPFNPSAGTLVEKNEVKNATTKYKNRKIGKLALFKAEDIL